jgi:ATP-binding cassette, subfamily B, multidrug efflux pump
MDKTNEQLSHENALAAVKARNEDSIKRSKTLHIYRSLAKYLNGYWLDVVLAWVFVACEVVCEVLVPFFSQNLVDALSVGSSNDIEMSTIWTYALIMMGMAVASCLFGILAGWVAARAAAGFGKNLRKAMYYHIQDYSFSNIDKFSTASLVTRLTTDVTNIQFSVQMILRMVVRAPMMMVVAFAMACVKSWQLSMIILAILPFLGAVLFSISRIVHPIFVRVFNAYDDLNAEVQENLNGIRVVKSFGREAFEGEKFGNISYFIYRNFIRAEKILAFNNPAMQIAIYGAMLLVSYFGAMFINASKNNASLGFTTGALTSLLSYIMMILNGLMMVSMAFVMVTISKNSAERVTEVIVEQPDIVSKEGAIKEVKDGSVDFCHVSFRYSASASKDTLHDIDLHIPSGSTVGILGVTGSAKSTLISLIARLYDASEGEVKVGGINVKDYDLVSLRDSVSVVLQKNVLFSGTIKSNLLWGNENASDEEIKKAARLACADEFISTFPLGYDSPIDEGGTNVSGGQKQRLCIARALLKNPKILILDDSTSAVDTHTDSLIRQSFKTEIPDVTKFIIAQRILSIKDCDIIVLLDDGKILATGSNDELMKNSAVYREIYETQMGGGDFDEQ